ncbi:MAG: S9 family peptidase [Candidatus Korarchaeota archaeon NZ13-K]|nr:MAG: S9 family peptidase [Candidatus Korarchaeota archaeon NZ13-K]
MRPTDLDDFSKIVLIGPPFLRWDGDLVAFRTGRALLEEDSYDHRIWGLRPGEEPLPLTRGPRDGNPSWEPGGRRLVFVRKGNDGDSLILWTTAEEYPVLHWEAGIEDVEWASGSIALAVLREGRREDDVKTIRTIPFWENGEGWTYWFTRRLHAIDLMTGEHWPLSQQGLEVMDFKVSPDGRRVAFLALRDRQRPLNVSLFVSDMEGEAQELGDGSWYLRRVCWRSESRLGVVGHDLRRGLATNSHLFETPVDRWDPVDQLEWDRSIGNSLNSDVRGGMNMRPAWHEGWWYAVIQDGTQAPLFRFREGEVERVSPSGISVEGFDIRGGRIVLTAMRFDRPAEIYLVEGCELRALTRMNEGFASRVSLRRPEMFSFRASDGVEIECLYLAPDGDPPHPTVLYVHGGPATAFGEAFMHELHFLRQRGYGILLVNFRGSEGYGEEFRDIRGRYGERDYLDLMEALDEALRRGYADPERLAVMGGSYGGFMTNWIVGHTDRFKAAVTMRGICNWISDYGTTDIGFFFNPDQIGGHPWENFMEYWERSPLAHVKNVKTPTLIIHSDEDYRCWLDQALQFFTALRVLGVEAELVIFPKENHDLSRSGKPKHRIERLRRIAEWLDRHLREASVA